MSGSFDAARLLLNNGANVNADSVRGTPLHLATKLNQGGVALVALLLAKGANIATDAKRTQPLELALESGNTSVAALLIHKGAKKLPNKNEDEDADAIETQFEEAQELAKMVVSDEGFSSLDSDKDGFIVPSDLEESGAPMEAISELFPLADLDGDGKLDKEEYAIFSLILSELMQGVDEGVGDAFGTFDMSDIMESLNMNEDDPFMAFGGGAPFMGRGAGRRGGGDGDDEGESEERGPMIEEVDDNDPD